MEEKLSFVIRKKPLAEPCSGWASHLPPPAAGMVQKCLPAVHFKSQNKIVKNEIRQLILTTLLNFKMTKELDDQFRGKITRYDIISLA